MRGSIAGGLVGAGGIVTDDDALLDRAVIGCTDRAGVGSVGAGCDFERSSSR